MRCRHLIVVRTVAVCALFLLLGEVTSAQTRVGDNKTLSTEFRGLMQLDWLGSPEPESPVPAFGVRRARIGLKGVALGRVEYEVERSLRNTETPWRDLYINIAGWRSLEVQAGRFKIPFSREQLTSVRELDLVYRSLGATYLAPGRDVGVMAHGRLFSRRVRYQFGGFRAGGDNVRDAERRDPQHGKVFAGRLVVKPWSESKSRVVLRDVSLGAALTTGRVPEGAYSVRGETIAEVPLFPAVTVRGIRRRFGAEIDWHTGPVAVTAEAIRVVDQRLGQSVDDGPLPDIVADAWYVIGSWRISGHGKDARPGALYVSARLEDFRIRSGSGQPVPKNPRAEVIAPRIDRAWTTGVTWHVAPFVKIQANVIAEWRDHAAATRPDGRPTWSSIARVQFSS